MALIAPERKARLLPESSQASPPSSQASFHSPTANLTNSSVAGLSSTTVLPSASTSLPPHDHRYGYQNALASPKACASVWPSGRPLAFSFLPASRHSSQVCRILLRPVADLVPPRGAVGDLQADDRVRDGEPFLAVKGDRFRGFVKSALGLVDLLADIADVDDAVAIELRPIVDRADDVGTGAGLIRPR